MSKKHKNNIENQYDNSCNYLMTEKHICDICSERFVDKYDYNEHMKLKHYWVETYFCNPCNYVSCNKYHYKKHCETKKHNIQDKKYQKNKDKDKDKDIQKDVYLCGVCKRKYKSHSGYLRHYKKMHAYLDEPENTETNIVVYKDKNNKHNNLLSQTDNLSETSNISQLTNLVKTLINENKEIHDTLMKENKELKKTMIDIVKEPKIVNNNNCKTFNIIQFLNKDCKDAMNLTEFIQNLVVTFDDLHKIEEYGYMVGVKNSLIQTLQTMDKTKRPIHCTDTKRKQFYIKDDNSWNKDTNNQKLDTVLKQYNHNQLKTLSIWKTQHPNWIEQEHLQTHVNKLNKELTLLYSEAGTKIKNKIVSEICDATVLTKERDKVKFIDNDNDNQKE